ncbi:MAG TPA: flagellar biosynthesis anti-sigma factor FlgM [Syntrophomonadaceae bacterium]|jgi:flagellar biosynthesis anti-sigma factor FlgM|nr:flagellar biosynthesis anti-sigma factor FlgM [Syntrophomonadaceae bacterium]HRX20757.1 flagellar biosynthesis anti-sigma factor FlgM [Syntrophomonadaceae bacterium]
MKMNKEIYDHMAKLYNSWQYSQTPDGQTGIKPVADRAESDSIELSEQALKVNELIKSIKELPDVREEKIARIKEEIVNNTYKIPAQQLAEKMLAGD